ALARELLREAARQRHDPRLGDTVRQLVVLPLARARREVHDASPAALHHVHHRRAAGV
ncbi:MAG: hypothetical protein AVDCRST_MAG77-449, partial [uncultured Chloroflexi bacterium]